MRRGTALFRLGIFLALLTPAAASGAVPAVPERVAAVLADAKARVVDDVSTALPHVVRTEALAAGIADPEARSLALAGADWLRAEIYLRTNRAAQAGPVLDRGLRRIAAIREPVKVRGDLLMSRGNQAMLEDQAAAALAAFQQAYRIFVALQDRRSEALALQNLGALYGSANDNVRADRYYKQAAEAFDGDPMLSLSIHNRRGNVLLSLERYRAAGAEYLAALGIARGLNKPNIEALMLGNLARSQVEGRAFDAAERSLRRGFALTRTKEMVGLRRSLLATAAGLALEQGNYARAAAYIRDCFAGMDLATTSIEFRTAHLYAYRIFRRTGQVSLALRHLEAVRRLTDEAVKVSTTTSASLMSAQFDFARQETKIANLRREEAVRRAAFQRTLFLAIGGATLLLIALLSFGLVTLRRSRNQVRAANSVLAETNAALEKALRAKTEFLATTSHEIRTPLNGILGMTQVMLADPALAPGMRDRIGIVQDAGVTMRGLVDDILDVAKMETGTVVIVPAPMDLCDALRDSSRMWEEQARGKGLGFDLDLSDAPQWIVSDAARLRQIVFNLLSNAVKFTAQGKVGLRAVQEGEGQSLRLRLIVSDTGTGIPPGQCDAIFESFRQVDTSITRRFGGTGLGLTICRNLARALGGDILVESEEGQGSRFIVDLPLERAVAPVAAVGDARTEGAMLVLDRNPIARSMLRTLLEPVLGQLHFAASADAALDALAEGGVSQLLIDDSTLNSGAGDPMETLEKLVSVGRANGAVSSAILWARPDAAITAQLLRSGVTQVIEKPVTGDALVAALLAGESGNSGPLAPDPLVSRAA